MPLFFTCGVGRFGGGRRGAGKIGCGFRGPRGCAPRGRAPRGVAFSHSPRSEGRGAMEHREFDFSRRRLHRPAAAFSGVPRARRTRRQSRRAEWRRLLTGSPLSLGDRTGFRPPTESRPPPPSPGCVGRRRRSLLPAPRSLDASGSAPSSGRDARDHTRGEVGGDKVRGSHLREV